MTILDSSKLKVFADDNFEFDENGRKLSKWVENTGRKGEIARYEQFLLFSQCFQKTFTADTKKPGLVWERFKHIRLISKALIIAKGSSMVNNKNLPLVVYCPFLHLKLSTTHAVCDPHLYQNLEHAVAQNFSSKSVEYIKIEEYY